MGDIIETGAASIVYCGNTLNGNKKFYIDFCNGVAVITGKSAPRAAFCQLFKTGYYKNVRVTYHRTAAGKIVFSNLERC